MMIHLLNLFVSCFNDYYIQDLLKLLMSVLVNDKMLWVVKFFSMSPSVMYGTVMKWLGQAVYSSVYSCHVYSTAACVQCTAGQLPPSPQRPVGRRRAGGPESWAVFSAGAATRLSETNHLQLKFFVLRQMQVNEDLKFWNYLKQIIYNLHS